VHAFVLSLGAVDPRLSTSADLQIDLEEQTVHVHGQAIELTKIQYLLLTLLLRRAGQVVTDDELRARCLRTKASAESSVRNHIFKLRRRLGRAGGLIQCARGAGYYVASDARRVSEK